MKILLVEDEEKLASSLAKGLEKKSYAVDIVHRGDKAFDRISLNHVDYDIIILDLMLPGLDGTEVCKKMRELNITTPILVLTAKDAVDDKVELLLSGADDYMVKPFSFEELSARVQALLRRPAQSLPAILQINGIELDLQTRRVRVYGDEVHLTLKEFALLEYFMRNANMVINREDLLSHLWDFEYLSFSNVIDAHVKNLRRKLDQKGLGDILETVRGVGYRLKG